MDLVRDVLDQTLADRRGAPIGRIDGIVMQIDGDAQPRIVAIEVGSVAQARRLGPRFGRWMERLAQRWGRMKPNPCRFEWRGVKQHDREFRVDALASEVLTRAWERWLREHVIDRIPGA
jgi:hypothetical protein